MYLVVKMGIKWYSVFILDTISYKSLLGWRLTDRIDSGHWVNNVSTLPWMTEDNPHYKPIFNFGDEGE